MARKLNFIRLPERRVIGKRNICLCLTIKKNYTFNVNNCNTVVNSFKVEEKIVSCFAFLYFSVISFIVTDF
jgi:hypothetical protein